MPEVALVNMADFLEYRIITSNIDFDLELKPFVLEAQNFDLKPLLGSIFYNDLMQNRTELIYINLISGKSYTIPNSTFEVPFKGIKPFLCYMTFSRYVVEANIKSTPAGFKYKITDQSENPSSGDLQRLSDSSRSKAKLYEEELRSFLVHNKSDYPVIETVLCGDVTSRCDCGTLLSNELFYRNGKSSRPRISSIG